VVVAQVIDLKINCGHHIVMISLIILNKGDPGRSICINKKEIQQELGGFVYTNKIMVWWLVMIIIIIKTRQKTPKVGELTIQDEKKEKKKTERKLVEEFIRA